MTDIRAIVKDAAEKLVCSDAPGFDAWELFTFVTHIGRNDVLLNPEREVSEENLKKFSSLVDKRATGYPLQYILGEWDFYGYTFFVNENVLIPRCETEQIADEVCKYLRNKSGKVIFDLCSGSGCIGLSIAANNPDCRVYLFDISESALECSEKSLRSMGLRNAEIVSCDIFSGYQGKGLPLPDVIVSNPPYVTREEYNTLQTEIFFEPENAIVCDGDGLDFYRCIAEKWLPYLNCGGFFMFESGEEQPEKITEILKSTSEFNYEKYSICCEDDMYGICRFVKGGEKNVV